MNKMNKGVKANLTVAIIAISLFATGCGITVNRNNYYNYPYQSENKPIMKTTYTDYLVKTQAYKWNEQL
ncbi:MAG TPA: hypothetical protein PLC76_04390 [Saprospiraceae bacterium]|jgi:hypothetical protein|nr:MAG: hypothetical protein HWD63_13740 [Candidatus Parvibacillus calidus]HQP76844.1 hypothetical protein [Saprospiraceae bacterium]HRN33987.1 hypothetical protein [Saprospiraceae bacterium]HRP83940.1 hypothetical protein [Saprospiraceae bacterium]